MKKNKNILVSVSGGKDSQACLKICCEKFGADKVLGVFADTKWEHPTTYKHIQTMQDLYNVEIKTIHSTETGGDSVFSQIIDQKKFPTGKQRFCTSRLKTRPLYKHALKHAQDLNLGYQKCKLVIGIRASESKDRAKKYGDAHGYVEVGDYLESTQKMNRLYQLWLPILMWSTAEVFDYLDGDHNPLYDSKYKRVGCFPCLAHEGKRGLNNAYNYDKFGAAQKQRVIDLETILGKKHLPSNTSQTCIFCEI